MQSILRKLVLAPAVMASAALATGSAMAETPINVPFSFSVAGKTFPAGRYIVERDSHRAAVTLVTPDRSESVSWLIGPGSPAPTETKVALKFAEVGPTHVLESIQYGAQITNRLDKNIVERGSGQLAEGR